MSLTLLLHEKRRVIGIAEWFKDALQNLSFEKGPIREIPSDNFRNVGYNVVLSHFEVYVRIRITEEQRAPFFANARDEQTYLKRCKPCTLA